MYKQIQFQIGALDPPVVPNSTLGNTPSVALQSSPHMHLLVIMRKVSVKSVSKSKELHRPILVQHSINIHTETTTARNHSLTKATHRRSSSKHQSQLHSIEQMAFLKKTQHCRNNSGHKRRLSKVLYQHSRESQEKMNTFGPYDNQENTQGLDVFECRYVETGGVDRVLTGRNKPQLPTNVLGNLMSFKNTSTALTTNPDQRRHKAKAHAASKELKDWQEAKAPLTHKEVLKNYSHYLTEDQKQQILNYPNIYYLGHKTVKSFLSGKPQYDNQDRQYVYTLNDHIGYRYQILRFLGKGSYGQVFRVFDHKKKKEAAIKVIKNKSKYSKQALIQIGILNTIKNLDPHGYSGIVRIKESLIFRKHQCIVFQILSDNLYQLIKVNNLCGLNLELIKRFSIQLLNSLSFLSDHSIIHCDLKPQNILLVQLNRARIKIIDFGSSCFDSEIIYEYIQSRYYRAPEISLGIPYDSKIDMWSLACILVELYTGVPLFPGDTEQQQMALMMSTLGPPDEQLLTKAARRSVFFKEKSEQIELRDEVKVVEENDICGKTLREIVKDQLFLDFLEGILKWDPKQRMSPKKALQHEWIVQGLPPEIKQLHSLFEETKESARVRKECQKKLEMRSPRAKLPVPLPKSQEKGVRKPPNLTPPKRRNHSLPVKDPKPRVFCSKKPSLHSHRRELSTQK